MLVVHVSIAWHDVMLVWHDMMSRGHRGCAEVTLSFLFQTPYNMGGHWGHRGCPVVLVPFLLQTPTIWVSMDSPGPQQSEFDILSRLRTLRTPRVCGGHFVYCVSNPNNVGVYRLPWTLAVRIGAHIWGPTLQSPGKPERAGEARRADFASIL